MNFTKYDSYESYVNHQKTKVNNMMRKPNWSRKRLKEWSRRQSKVFVPEFKQIQHLLDKKPVLCLGARNGTEVHILRHLGFENSIGVDINPVPVYPGLVVEGDFHNLQYEDNSYHTIYCNSLDHCLDIDKVMQEIRRVLINGGKFITRGPERLPKNDEYGCCQWDSFDELVQVICKNDFSMIYKEKTPRKKKYFTAIFS